MVGSDGDHRGPDSAKQVPRLPTTRMKEAMDKDSEFWEPEVAGWFQVGRNGANSDIQLPRGVE